MASIANYSQITFFAPKDSLLSGNPAKIIKGADVDPELSAISVAIATKYDSTSIATGQITFADGTVGAPSITFVGSLTTGLYLPAANQLGVTTSGVQRLTVSSAGAVAVNAPTSGVALTVTGLSGSDIADFTTAASTVVGKLKIQNSGSGAGTKTRIELDDSVADLGYLEGDCNGAIVSLKAVNRNNQLDFWTGSAGGAQRVLIGSAGNVTINHPTSGSPLTVGDPTGSAANAGSIQQVTNGATFSIVPDPTSGANGVTLSTSFANGGNGPIKLSPGGHDTMDLSSLGNVTINAPSSGIAAAINGLAGNYTLELISGNVPASGSADLYITRANSTANTIASGPSIQLADSTNSTNTLIQNAGGQTELWQYNGGWSQILKVASTRGVTINAPSSGNALAVQAVNSGWAAVLNSAGGAGTALGALIRGGTNTADAALQVQDATATNIYFNVQGDGQNFIRVPPAFTDLSGSTLYQVGYLETPPNAQNANYTFALSDRGKTVTHTSASPHTYTIPANASVAFPIGTAIVIQNLAGGGAVTLAITTDTLLWVPTATTGSRTLGSCSQVTISKVTATSWYVSGAGIT